VGDGILMLKSLTFKVHILDHNLKQYQRSNIKISNIKIFQPSFSILLAYGGNNVVLDHNDYANLINLLQGVIKVMYVPNYAHGDFVFGITNGTILYNHIFSFFEA
jgi:lysosomal acid lipase/cholesteryl ester hydrolase